MLYTSYIVCYAVTGLVYSSVVLIVLCYFTDECCIKIILKQTSPQSMSLGMLKDEI